MKPIILTTAGIENTSRGLIQSYCYKTYSEAIAQSGGIPLIVGDDSNLEYLADMANGLYLTGGDDIDSAHYQGDPQYCLTPDRWRDHLEMRLIQLFIEKKKPIFGICRGMQLINVELGGSLYEDLQVRRGIHHPMEVYHTVYAAPDSLCRRWFGEEFLVNSFHHQAINKLGSGLRIVARTHEGLIEAFTHKELPIFGLQWHPERMTGPNPFTPDGPNMKPMFDHFIYLCKTWGMDPSESKKYSL